MRYHLGTGVIKKRRKRNLLLFVLAIIVLLAGIYLLFLTTVAPRLNTVFGTHTAKASAEPQVDSNRLYIPKISVNLAINTGGTDALNNGVWHRYPERGDPAKGGNFILAGHRFSIAFTPQDVVRLSPLYDSDKLAEGDKMYVDYSGKRYEYTVSKKYTVKPTQVSIEDSSPDDPHMTLYTCSMSGEADGRLVIIAHLTDNN